MVGSTNQQQLLDKMAREELNRRGTPSNAQNINLMKEHLLKQPPNTSMTGEADERTAGRTVGGIDMYKSQGKVDPFDAAMAKAMEDEEAAAAPQQVVADVMPQARVPQVATQETSPRAPAVSDEQFDAIKVQPVPVTAGPINQDMLNLDLGEAEEQQDMTQLLPLVAAAAMKAPPQGPVSDALPQIPYKAGEFDAIDAQPTFKQITDPRNTIALPDETGDIVVPPTEKSSTEEAILKDLDKADDVADDGSGLKVVDDPSLGNSGQRVVAEDGTHYYLNNKGEAVFANGDLVGTKAGPEITKAIQALLSRI